MNVLVAGGAGYIGSHTVKRLKEAGHAPVIYDNFERGHFDVVDILKVPHVRGDLNERERLVNALKQHRIDAVMHFAAFIAVGESVEHPLRFYQNNVATTINVLQSMQEAQVNRFVFSSTCAIYGDPDKIPITENEKQAPVSPYGRTKMQVEQILNDLPLGWKDFKFAALRYFNASGCAFDGSLGEDHDPETHLIPVLLQAVLGVRPGITVFGTDYPTKDGTNVRDYIHVEDLADAHIAAMTRLDEQKKIVCNLGTGNGFSVKEVIATVEKVTGKKVPVTYGPRRAGDAITLYADPSYAKKILGWEAKYRDPEPVIASAWRWFKDHPRGYGSKPQAS